MAQKLPHDVFELLLDECQSDGADNTVGLCGLVCKAWLHPSRARLFTTVVLREHNSNSFLDIVQTSPFPIQSFIHTLHIIIRKKNTFLQETKVEVLGPFPEVTALYIDADVRDWIPEMAATFFPNKFPRLSKLSLSVSDTSLYFFDILSAVTPFPTLESLEMDVAGGFDFTTDDVPETYRIPPNWHTLHFDMDMGNIFLEMMFDLASDSDSDSDSEEFSIPLFSTLRLQDSWPQGRSFFGRYLHTYGHKIHRLGFDCASENMDSEPDALRCCTALRCLDLRMKTSRIPGTLFGILKYLDSSALTTINVVDPDQWATKSLARQADKWQKLDQALAKERFASVSTLSFTGPSTLEKKLREGLPLCAARGILRVVDA